jgi:hypothetical protein
MRSWGFAGTLRLQCAAAVQYHFNILRKKQSSDRGKLGQNIIHSYDIQAAVAGLILGRLNVPYSLAEVKRLTVLRNSRGSSSVFASCRLGDEPSFR